MTEGQRLTQKYNERIDEIIEDLRYFGSGGYLTEQERDTWLEPFDVDDLPRLREVMTKFVTTALSHPVEMTVISEDVTDFYKDIDELNDELDAPLIEAEEIEDIESFVRDLYEDIDVPAENIDTLPTFAEVLDSLEDED